MHAFLHVTLSLTTFSFFLSRLSQFNNSTVKQEITICQYYSRGVLGQNTSPLSCIIQLPWWWFVFPRTRQDSCKMRAGRSHLGRKKAPYQFQRLSFVKVGRRIVDLHQKPIIAWFDYYMRCYVPIFSHFLRRSYGHFIFGQEVCSNNSDRGGFGVVHDV